MSGQVATDKLSNDITRHERSPYMHLPVTMSSITELPWVLHFDGNPIKLHLVTLFDWLSWAFLAWGLDGGESLDGLDEYLGALCSILDWGTRIGELPYLFLPCLGVIISSTGGRSESESTMAADLYLQWTSVPIIKFKKWDTTNHFNMRVNSNWGKTQQEDQRTRLAYIYPAW